MQGQYFIELGVLAIADDKGVDVVEGKRTGIVPLSIAAGGNYRNLD